MLHFHGLAVSAVNAKKAHIEIIPGEVEVIGVAAEERDAIFRRHHQSNVREAAVLVQVVATAAIKADHFTAKVVAGRALFFNRSLGCALYFSKLVISNAFGRLLQALGDVGDLCELVQLEPGALRLIGL